MNNATKLKAPRQLTGRTVLFCLLGYFGLVFAVNGVLVVAATSTFGGLETGSSYKAGLQFKQEMQSAERQASLHWTVDGKLTRGAAGQTVLDVSVLDEKGLPIAGLTGAARLAHPATSRLDHTVALEPSGAGALRGTAAVPAGQWELILDFDRGGDRVFRSRSRVTLK